MNTARLVMFTLLWCGLLPMSLVGADSAQYIVVSRQASLYVRAKSVTSLHKHDIVWARPAKRPGWLVIDHNDTLFTARRKHFETRAQIEDRLAAEAETATKQLQAVDTAIPARLKDVKQLHTELLSQQQDSVIELIAQGVHVSHIRTPTGTHNARSIPIRTVKKLAQKEQRTRQDQLATQLEAVTNTLNDHRENKRNSQQRIANNRITLAWVRQRFIRHNAGDRDYRSEQYRVGNRGATLYNDQRTRVARLNPGTIVRAQPDRQHQGWLTINAGDQTRRADGRSMVSKTELARRHVIQTIAAEAEESALLDDITILRTRQDVLQRLYLETVVLADSNGRLAASTDSRHCELCRDIDTNCVHGVIEMSDRSKTRKLLKRWDKQRALIADALKEKWNALVDIRRAQARRDGNYAAYEQMLARDIAPSLNDSHP